MASTGRASVTVQGACPDWLEDWINMKKEISKSDDSCISNPEIPKSQIGPVQFKVSNFEFEMQDSSDFKLSFYVRSAILIAIAVLAAITPLPLAAQNRGATRPKVDRPDGPVRD